MEGSKIEIQGLPDLTRSLRQLDKDLPKELASGLQEAAQIVVTHAQTLVPKRSGDAAGSIKAKKSQRAAAISVGGNKAPYFPWLDFGGRVGKNNSVSRPFLSKGRYIYPSLDVKRKQVDEKVDEVIQKMAGKAGFDQKGRAS